VRGPRVPLRPGTPNFFARLHRSGVRKPSEADADSFAVEPQQPQCQRGPWAGRRISPLEGRRSPGCVTPRTERVRLPVCAQRNTLSRGIRSGGLPLCGPATPGVSRRRRVRIREALGRGKASDFVRVFSDQARGSRAASREFLPSGAARFRTVWYEIPTSPRRGLRRPCVSSRGDWPKGARNRVLGTPPRAAPRLVRGLPPLTRTGGTLEHVHVREAMAGHLRPIDEDLANRVAAGLARWG